MNIVVLAGGTSTERDVSISTSAMVCKSLRRNGHNANMIDVFLGCDSDQESKAFFEDDNDIDELAQQLTEASQTIAEIEQKRKAAGEGFFGPSVLDLCMAADIVFIGLHGANGEDGRIQGMFDLLGIRYTGTGYLSSAISMSKDLTKKVLVAAGIPMPNGITLTKGKVQENVTVSFPCVVKPCCGGSSVGVSIVNDETEYQAALNEAFRCEDEVLVEEFVKGREFSVGVIDGKALPIIEIQPVSGFYDYKNKYKAGATIETCPADLPEELADQMKRWAEKACQVAGIQTYARVDELVNEQNQIFCLEINTLPGMTPTSLLPQEAQAEGMNYDQLTEKIIESSMQKYQ